jgi:hypothetical protein
MNSVPGLLRRLLRPVFLALYLFVFILVFQVMLITRLPALYPVLKILFVGLVLLLLAFLVRASARDKTVAVIVLAIVLLRLPFFFHPTGLITMSDNALEAVQSLEIQDSRTVPFYQFGVLNHQGTLRYLLVAYIWDFTGTHYLALTLWNLVIFIAIILLLARILEPVIPRSAMILLSLLSFAFIETMFDFSLLIRGGIYLDALLLFLLGVRLFDFEFKRRTPILAAYFFMFFAYYIQPIALIFSGSFVVVAAVLAWRARRFWMNLWLLAAGAFLGSLHLLYYELFSSAKPATATALERVSLIPWSAVSWDLFRKLGRLSVEAFSNLFRYEFSYFMGTVPVGPLERVLAGLNAACLYLSTAVFFAGLGMALLKTAGLVRKKKPFEVRDWPYLFFLALTVGSAAKFMLLRPPRLEPRHNLDLLLLVVLAYYFVLGALVRRLKIRGPGLVAVGLVLLAFTAPQYFFYLKNTVAKEASYSRLMTGLRAYGVKDLVTDFNLAFPVYFLSGRTIQVSDSIGPLRQKVYFAPMRARVDGLPDSSKAWLFYTEKAGTRPWHKRATRRVVARLLDRLDREKIPYQTVDLGLYRLIVPEKDPSPHPPREAQR